jgi:antitoxin VapB
METTAKLFTNGRSQAVRIPKAYQFEGVSEVVIRREGDALVIVPARKTWTSYPGDAPSVGDDFLIERPALMDDDGRVVL